MASGDHSWQCVFCGMWIVGGASHLCNMGLSVSSPASQYQTSLWLALAPLTERLSRIEAKLDRALGFDLAAAHFGLAEEANAA